MLFLGDRDLPLCMDVAELVLASLILLAPTHPSRAIWLVINVAFTLRY